VSGSTLQIALYALLCVIWGSTWLVIKIGYGGLGPFNVAAVRFFVAGAILAALVPAFRARWPSGRVEWALVAWIGLVLFAADYGLIYWAEQYIESGLTAILFAILPLITIVCAHVYVPGDRITPRKLAGTLLAFVGVAALFSDHVRLDMSRIAPMAAVVASAVCAAMAAVASKRHGTDLHPAALNAPAMGIGAVALLGASLLAGDGFSLPADTATWGAVSYLAVAVSVVTFLIYFWLLKSWSVTSLSFISVFTPAVALLLGFVFLDERPTTWTLVGSAAILGGVVLAVGNPKSQAPNPKSQAPNPKSQAPNPKSQTHDPRFNTPARPTLQTPERGA
jgi:drug/metabolite transporter (DMT)-like permease